MACRLCTDSPIPAFVELGKLKFTSQDENIASIDNNGKITAKEIIRGKTKIEIEDIDNGYKTQVKVYINRLQNTEDITYIYDEEDLCTFRENVNNGNNYLDKTVYLMDDIDLKNVCGENMRKLGANWYKWHNICRKL